MLNMLIGRRDQCKQELEKGRQLLKQKETELADIRQSLVRLEGAIQVLDETIEDMRKEDQGES